MTIRDMCGACSGVAALALKVVYSCFRVHQVTITHGMEDMSIVWRELQLNTKNSVVVNIQ